MGTKTAAFSGLDGEGIIEGGVRIEVKIANHFVTELPCGGKKTPYKNHIKPVEKMLVISSLIGCRTPEIHAQMVK